MKIKEQYPIVEIAVISDDGFIVPSVVMLTSAKFNKSPSSKYRIHFFSVGLNAFWQRKLLELSSDDFEIIIYETDTEKYKEVGISIHVTPTTFLKIDLAQLLPNVDKVLHIDGDVLVFQDLTELYSEELNDSPLGVVNSMYLDRSGYIKNVVGVEKGFNAGIMLMNLKEWRQSDATEKLTSMLLSAPKEWIYLEQDCMSAYFYGNLKYLHPRNNCCFYVWKDNYAIEELNEYYGMDYSCYEELIDDAVILHLAGTPGRRPWQVVNGVFADVWQMYYDRSPLKHLHIERADLAWNLFIECYPILLIKYWFVKVWSELCWGKKRRIYKVRKKQLYWQIWKVRRHLKKERQNH